MVMLICRFVLGEWASVSINWLWGVDCNYQVWDGLDEGMWRLPICVGVLSVGCFEFFRFQESDWSG